MLVHTSPSSPRLTTYLAARTEAFFFMVFYWHSFPTKFFSRPLVFRVSSQLLTTTYIRHSLISALSVSPGRLPKSRRRSHLLSESKIFLLLNFATPLTNSSVRGGECHRPSVVLGLGIPYSWTPDSVVFFLILLM